MDSAYYTAKRIITDAKQELERVLKDAPYHIMEDQEGNSTLETIIEQLEIAERDFAYLSRPAKEGTLIEDGCTGKFLLSFDDDKESYFLNCGSDLELFSAGEWLLGRVEARDGQYYFHGEGRPFLASGMRARRRI